MRVWLAAHVGEGVKLEGKKKRMGFFFGVFGLSVGDWKLKGGCFLCEIVRNTRNVFNCIDITCRDVFS